ncbi:MAG TPA: Rnf-Nqr domain containing protein, partial [Candidatus Limiplasma sp.]|nr:Rnf-Nqr domain containing protein [Candidatus Limiplasma sp.]
AGALGFTLALVAFAAIREKLAMNDLPKWMDGFPGALIAAGLMAVAFQGFAGLI